MNVFLTEPPDPQPAICMRIQGGSGAPGRARRSVLSQLSGQLTESGAGELALIISELVTNSVRHANVGPQQTLTVECTGLPDRLRVTVTDPGSDFQPRLRTPDHPAAGGRGLRIVESLSSAWGVLRGSAGTTSVWCELPFEASPLHRSNQRPDDIA
jgi:anti-sigma regulatory factor (Ser/Thr protein kinase)